MRTESPPPRVQAQSSKAVLHSAASSLRHSSTDRLLENKLQNATLFPDSLAAKMMNNGGVSCNNGLAQITPTTAGRPKTILEGIRTATEDCLNGKGT